MKKFKIFHHESVIYKFFRENEALLKKFLRRYVSNFHDIEDICQETILRALEAEKSRDIRAPRAFLFGISKNIVRKRLDKESASLIDFINDLSPIDSLTEEFAVEESIDSHNMLLIFTEAVSRLPKQCQRVFILKKVYGYSHKEISKKLGISISTVEKHVATGLTRCDAYLDMKIGGQQSGIKGDTCYLVRK